MMTVPNDFKLRFCNQAVALNEPSGICFASRINSQSTSARFLIVPAAKRSLE